MLIWTILGLALLPVWTFIAEEIASAGKTYVLEANLRWKIRNARLLGASPSEVIVFLDRQQLAHGEFHRQMPGSVQTPREYDRTISAELDRDQIRLGKLPVLWRMFILFRFDAHDRLISYRVRREMIIL